MNPEVSMPLNMKIIDFWAVMLFSLTDTNILKESTQLHSIIPED
jgi:hypothetical protein